MATVLGMQRLKDVLESRDQRGRRVSPDDGCDHHVWSGLGEHDTFADREPTQPSVVGRREGIGDEIANRREHPGHQIGSRALRVLGDRMGQEKTGLAVNQEDLLDLIHQRVSQHDVGVGHPCAPRLEAPLQSSRRQAVVDRTVHRVEEAGQGLGDGLTDSRPQRRVDCVGERVRVPVYRLGDRCFDGRGKCAGQLVVAGSAIGDRFGQDVAHGVGRHCEAIDPILKFPQPLLLRPDQKLAQLVEVA